MKLSRPVVILLTILASLLLGLVIGLITGWVVWPVSYINTDIGDLRLQHKEDYIAMVASAYALDGDLSKAQERLDKLGAANVGQLVAAVASKYIAEGRQSEEIRNLALLADALGTAHGQMIAYIATPTPTSTPTPVPTTTFTLVPPTPTPIPTDTPVPPTPTPVPTNTPIPPTATRVPPTPTPAPPTNTPVPQPPTNTPPPPPPTDTPVPTRPPVDFVVVEQRMLSNVENGGTSVNGEADKCGYGHNVYIKVIDANGVPLDNIIVFGIYSNIELRPTGVKGPGMTEPEFFGGGDAFKVIRDAATGQQYTSQETAGLSTQDEAIPIPWLIAGGYCRDEANCAERIRQNRLCRGHYSYSVVFQRTW